MSQGTYIDGGLDGEWIAWFENEEVKSVSNWGKGKEEGEYIEYYPKGQKNK